MPVFSCQKNGIFFGLSKTLCYVFKLFMVPILFLRIYRMVSISGLNQNDVETL